MDLKHSLLEAMTQHEECLYVSMDGTFRICMPVMGQAKFNAPATVRAEYPSDDASSLRRVITLRGRTGAVLGMVPAGGESAEELARCFTCALSDAARRQVQFVASDEPSPKLHTQLRQVLPNMLALALDPTHTPMRYEQANGGRKTKASMLLRSIMAKFCPRRSVPNVWSDFFDGSTARPLSAPEQAVRSQIQEGTSAQRRAQKISTIGDCALLANAHPIH